MSCVARPPDDPDAAEPTSCMFLTVFHGTADGRHSETENVQDGPVAKTRVGPNPPTPEMGPTVYLEFSMYASPLVAQVLVDAGAALELAERIVWAAEQARCIPPARSDLSRLVWIEQRRPTIEPLPDRRWRVTLGPHAHEGGHLPDVIDDAMTADRDDGGQDDEE